MSSSIDVQPVHVLGNPPLISDGKKLIEAKYTKLHGRFNVAFNGLPDDMTLKDAIDTIAGDVSGWLAAMPDNYKTSNHALSRPKFGLSFLLQNEEVRAILGGEYCDLKNTSIERAFEALKKDFVIPSEKKEKEKDGSTSSKREREREAEPDVLVGDGEFDELRETLAKVMARNAELEESNRFLSTSLIRVFQDQYGETPAGILQSLFAGM